MSLKIIKTDNYDEIRELVKANNGHCPCSIIKDETTKLIIKTWRPNTYFGKKNIMPLINRLPNRVPAMIINEDLNLSTNRSRSYRFNK